MLELMLDRHVIYVLMGMSAFAGVVSKVVVGRTLRKLVAAAESMGKSNHPLMRLVHKYAYVFHLFTDHTGVLEFRPHKPHQRMITLPHTFRCCHQLPKCSSNDHL